MTQAAAATPATPAVQQQMPSLIAKFADRFGVEANKMVGTLKATAFRAQGTEISNEQMMALLIVADQYGLNPWTKEIFAFPDKNNGIVPVVGVDGWIRIINDSPAFRGYEFEYGPSSENPKHKGAPSWIQCTIIRSDREKPIVIREYLAECYRDTGPWQSHPARMLRHKTLIQCGRVAFGFGGIYVEDEARAIVEVNPLGNGGAAPAIDSINAEVSARNKTAKNRAQDADVVDKTATATTAEYTGGAPDVTVDGVLAGMDKAADRDALDVATSLGDALNSADDRELVRKRYNELLLKKFAPK